MAAVYSNPPLYGVSGKELIVRWEPLYKKYLKQNIVKRSLKKGELMRIPFMEGISLTD